MAVNKKRKVSIIVTSLKRVPRSFPFTYLTTHHFATFTLHLVEMEKEYADAKLSGSNIFSPVDDSEHREDVEQAKSSDAASYAAIEARLRRKFDRRVLPLAILLYFSAFIDRSNMGNARILGLEDDINLTGNRFNIALTAFFVTYILFDM